MKSQICRNCKNYQENPMLKTVGFCQLDKQVSRLEEDKCWFSPSKFEIKKPFDIDVPDFMKELFGF